LVQNVCTPQSVQNIYQGGLGTGFQNINLIQAVCTY
jgi:hypothetical protein